MFVLFTGIGHTVASVPVVCLFLRGCTSAIDCVREYYADWDSDNEFCFPDELHAIAPNLKCFANNKIDNDSLMRTVFDWVLDCFCGKRIVFTFTNVFFSCVTWLT